MPDPDPDPNTQLLTADQLMRSPQYGGAAAAAPAGPAQIDPSQVGSTDYGYQLPEPQYSSTRLMSSAELTGVAPQPLNGPAHDSIFQSAATTVGKIMHAFGYGFSSQIGDRKFGLSEEDAAKLRAMGVFPDYQKGQDSFWQGAAEAVIRPVAAGMDFALNALPAAATGAEEVARRTAEHLQGGPGIALNEQGLPESVGAAAALPFGIAAELLSGVRKGYYPELGEYGAAAAAGRAASRASAVAEMTRNLDTARAAGAIGETEAQFHGVEPPTPEQAAERVQAARDAGIEPIPPTPAPPTLDDLARRLDPDTFEVYDRAFADKTAARAELDALAAQPREDRPEVVEARNHLNQILGIEPDVPARAGAFEERLASMAATAPDAVRDRLADAYDKWAALMEEDTPEMRAARDRIQAADEQMRDLAVQVSDAYRNAREMGPALPAAEAPPSGVPASALPSIPADAQSVAAAEQRAVGAGEAAAKEGGGGVVGEETLGRKGKGKKAKAKAEEEPAKLPVEIEEDRQASAIVQEAVAQSREAEAAEARGEPHAPPGTVRVYHGGEVAPDHAGPLRVTRDRADAEADAKAAGPRGTVHAIDVTPEELRAAGGPAEELGPLKPAAPGIELPAEVASRRVMVQAPGEAAAATEAAKPTKPVSGLRPVTGTGETVTRGLAQHIEDTAVASDLTQGFGDLPEYRRVNMAVQAKAAAELVNTDYETAKAIAMGERAPPAGLLPESVLVAVEKGALANGDVDTLRELATQSKLVTAATTMGQRIRTLGERIIMSPVTAIQTVQEAREAAAAREMAGEKVSMTPSPDAVRKFAAAKDAVIDEIKSETRKQPTTDSWSAFIDTLKCGE